MTKREEFKKFDRLMRCVKRLQDAATRGGLDALTVSAHGCKIISTDTMQALKLEMTVVGNHPNTPFRTYKRELRNPNERWQGNVTFFE